jgi:hypothetical protein
MAFLNAVKRIVTLEDLGTVHNPGYNETTIRNNAFQCKFCPRKVQSDCIMVIHLEKTRVSKA